MSIVYMACQVHRQRLHQRCQWSESGPDILSGNDPSVEALLVSSVFCRIKRKETGKNGKETGKNPEEEH